MRSTYSIGPSRVVLVQGDITRETTDAIVNAANASLLGGGGVDGAIHRAAGPELLAACREVKKALPNGLLAAGGCIATPGCQLFARYVLHCVGPIYDDDRAKAPRLLASCYANALSLTRELGLRSVAFPAISTGVYGYPMAAAAHVALRTIAAELTQHRAPELVRVVLFDRAALDAFVTAADALLRA